MRRTLFLLPLAVTVTVPGGACSSESKVRYADCDAVRAAGKAPLQKGDPGYSKALDRDGDGTACA